jgi:hypothetical protein
MTDVYGWMNKEIFNRLSTLNYTYMAIALAPPLHVIATAEEHFNNRNKNGFLLGRK